MCMSKLPSLGYLVQGNSIYPEMSMDALLSPVFNIFLSLHLRWGTIGKDCFQSRIRCRSWRVLTIQQCCKSSCSPSCVDTLSNLVSDFTTGLKQNPVLNEEFQQRSETPTLLRSVQTASRWLCRCLFHKTEVVWYTMLMDRASVTYKGPHCHSEVSQHQLK